MALSMDFCIETELTPWLKNIHQQKTRMLKIRGDGLRELAIRLGNFQRNQILKNCSCGFLALENFFWSHFIRNTTKLLNQDALHSTDISR